MENIHPQYERSQKYGYTKTIRFAIIIGSALESSFLYLTSKLLYSKKFELFPLFMQQNQLNQTVKKFAEIGVFSLPMHHILSAILLNFCFSKILLAITKKKYNQERFDLLLISCSR